MAFTTTTTFAVELKKHEVTIVAAKGDTFHVRYNTGWEKGTIGRYSTLDMKECYNVSFSDLEEILYLFAHNS